MPYFMAKWQLEVPVQYSAASFRRSMTLSCTSNEKRLRVPNSENTAGVGWRVPPFGQFAEYAVHVGHVSQRTVLYFGYDGKQGDFVKGGLVQIVRDFNVQVPVLVQMDAYLLRLEAEGGEPLPIDPRQETAVAGHVFQLFGSKYGLCQAVHRLLQFLQKRVRIGGVVSVLEAESAHGIGKQFDVGIRGGEFVKVCIEYGMNHGRIFFGYDVRFWG